MVSFSVPGEKPFFCPSDGCVKTFSSQYSLKSHVRGHDKGPAFTMSSHQLSEVRTHIITALSVCIVTWPLLDRGLNWYCCTCSTAGSLAVPQ